MSSKANVCGDGGRGDVIENDLTGRVAEIGKGQGAVTRASPIVRECLGGWRRVEGVWQVRPVDQVRRDSIGPIPTPGLVHDMICTGKPKPNGNDQHVIEPLQQSHRRVVKPPKTTIMVG